MRSPDISVVMSVYNGEKYLYEAIQSILDQTFKDFEFIIVNDGSTDNSLKIIETFIEKDKRIKLISQGNCGLAEALNRGIEIARGKYIARLDADDIALQDRLKIQYEFMELNPEYIVCGSSAIIIDKDGNYLYTSKLPLNDVELKNNLPLGPVFYHSSTFFCKESVLDVGGYNSIVKHQIEDIILWNNLSSLGKFLNIEEPLIKYRLVPNSISNRPKEEAGFLSSVLLDVIDRKDEKSYLEILSQLQKKVSPRKRLSLYYLKLGKIFIERNFNRKKAFYNLRTALIYKPNNFNAWFNLFLLLLPKIFIIKWKNTRV